MSGYIRETPEEERRAKARQRVAGLARNGRDLSSYFERDYLDWAFTGRDDELAELERVAEQVRAERTAAAEQREQRQQLAAMTDRVLAEWDAERRTKAQAEARRRLDLPEPT